jgi:hypothetical protein
LTTVIQLLSFPMLGCEYKIHGQRLLRYLCTQLDRLPTNYTISDGLVVTGEGPIASGGFSDVWRGSLNEQAVAIKRLCISKADDMTEVTNVH